MSIPPVYTPAMKEIYRAQLAQIVDIRVPDTTPSSRIHRVMEMTYPNTTHDLLLYLLDNEDYTKWFNRASGAFPILCKVLHVNDHYLPDWNKGGIKMLVDLYKLYKGDPDTYIPADDDQPYEMPDTIEEFVEQHAAIDSVNRDSSSGRIASTLGSSSTDTLANTDSSSSTAGSGGNSGSRNSSRNRRGGAAGSHPADTNANVDDRLDVLTNSVEKLVSMMSSQQSKIQLLENQIPLFTASPAPRNRRVSSSPEMLSPPSVQRTTNTSTGGVGRGRGAGTGDIGSLRGQIARTVGFNPPVNASSRDIDDDIDDGDDGIDNVVDDPIEADDRPAARTNGLPFPGSGTIDRATDPIAFTRDMVINRGLQGGVTSWVSNKTRFEHERNYHECVVLGQIIDALLPASGKGDVALALEIAARRLAGVHGSDHQNDNFAFCKAVQWKDTSVTLLSPALLNDALKTATLYNRMNGRTSAGKKPVGASGKTTTTGHSRGKTGTASVHAGNSSGNHKTRQNNGTGSTSSSGARNRSESRGREGKTGSGQ